MSTVERDNEAAVEAQNQTSPPNTAGIGTGGISTSAPVKEVVKQEPRPYIVLVEDKVGTWVHVAEVPANSAEQAIRKAVETPGKSFLKPEGATTLVAVPARSWNPVSVSVKTETSIVLS